KLRDKIKKQESELDEMYQRQFEMTNNSTDEAVDSKIVPNNPNDDLDLLYDEIVKKKLIKSFEEMVDDTFKRSRLEMVELYKPPKDFFIKHDLFITKPMVGGFYSLEITPKGKRLQMKILSSEHRKELINSLENNK
ncbi:MAG TPA: hypothetical protein PLN22_12405, partial [Ignavibacteria bacterium]|nr:hypothetical protein [Ignavibacteria bacterium]